MKLVVISDTHGKHNQIKLPEGDVLIHCGDFSGHGWHNEVRSFIKWMNEQPFKYKLFIAGNHDCTFQEEPRFKEEALRLLAENTIYLEDSSFIYNEDKRVVFYGSPWQPEFGDWAFNLPRGGEELRARWSAIPEDTNVLITHGPPKGILDRCKHEYFGYPPDAGCELLYDRIQNINPKYHLFGHIHEGYGMDGYYEGLTVYVNASTCDLSYDPRNNPVEIEI